MVSTDETTALLLHLQKGQARYRGINVLHDIDISIRDGERIALLGKSGAGKSTLLTLMYRQLIERGENVALIPQQLGLVHNLSAWHNIYVGRLPRYRALYNLANLFWRFSARDREIREFAAKFGLESHLNKPAGELSGGQQQRVAIARALYSGAPVILADEPVAGLDGPLAEQVLTELNRHSHSLVVALHDTELARRFCDRVIGIRDGRIVLDCPATNLGSAETDALYKNHAPD